MKPLKPRRGPSRAQRIARGLALAVLDIATTTVPLSALALDWAESDGTMSAWSALAINVLLTKYIMVLSR